MLFRSPENPVASYLQSQAFAHVGGDGILYGDGAQHRTADCLGLNTQHSSETGRNNLVSKKEGRRATSLPCLTWELDLNV